MTKALELAKFGRETPPAGVVVGDSDAQTLSSKTFSDMPVFSSGAVNAVPYLNASKVFSTSATFVFDGTNLGIGVASPAQKLDVNGTVKIGSGSGETLTVGSLDLGKDIGLGDGYGIVTGNARVLTFRTSGNIGMGTSSPAYKLEVAAGTSGQQSLAGFRTADATTANNAGLMVFATPSATAASRSVVAVWDADGANSSGGDYFLINKNGNSGTVDIFQYSNAAIQFGANYIGRATVDMVLSATGNLGIGNPTPALKLDVNGSIKMSGGTGTALTWDTAIGSQYLKYDSTLDGLILAGYGGLGFRVAGSATNAITVSSTGNLGIGAAPTAVTGFGINKFLEIGGASVPGLVLRPTGSTSEHSVLGAGDGLLIGAAGAATATNNVIRFFTSNVNSSNSSLGERMRVASNGHIGIGTTNPISNAPSTSGVLHINTVDVGGWAITHYTNGSTGAGAGDGVVIGNIGLDTYIFNYEAGDIIFGTSGSAKARITSAGVFDTPTVQTSGTPVGTFSASKWFTQTEDTTTTRTYFCGPNTTTYGSWEIYNAKSNGTPLIAAAFTADYTKFGIPSSSSEAMRITNAGNLAIGTTANTAQKLNVNGGLWLIASDYPSYSTQFLPRLDSTHPFTIQTRNNDSTMVNWLGIYSDNAGAAPRIVLGQGGWPVGIGTTAPQGLLQVGATGNALIYVNSVLTEIAPPTSGNDLYIFRSQNDGSMNFSARPGGGSAYRFWGGATQYMFINSSGNVGIGADPTVKLEVNGEIKSANININQNNNLLYFTKTGGSTGTSSNNTHFIGRVDNTGFHVTSDAGGFASVADSFVIGAKGSLILGTSTPTSTYTTGRVMITQEGKVGIGTPSPNYALHVTGGVRTGNEGVIVGNTAEIDVTFGRLTSNGADTAWGQNILTYPGTWTKASSASVSGGFVINGKTFSFSTSDAGSSSPLQYARMRMNASGNLGIGYDEATARLDVNGQTKTNSLFVRNSAGSGDVGYLGSKQDWQGGGADNSLAIGAYSANMYFYTNNNGTPRAAIDSSGTLQLLNNQTRRLALIGSEAKKIDEVIEVRVVSQDTWFKIDSRQLYASGPCGSMMDIKVTRLPVHASMVRVYEYRLHQATWDNGGSYYNTLYRVSEKESGWNYYAYTFTVRFYYPTSNIGDNAPLYMKISGYHGSYAYQTFVNLTGVVSNYAGNPVLSLLESAPSLTSYSELTVAADY